MSKIYTYIELCAKIYFFTIVAKSGSFIYFNGLATTINCCNSAHFKDNSVENPYSDARTLYSNGLSDYFNIFRNGKCGKFIH
jgi:hypothetical protein